MPPLLAAIAHALSGWPSLALPPGVHLSGLSLFLSDVLDSEETREMLAENMEAAIDLGKKRSVEVLEERRVRNEEVRKQQEEQRLEREKREKEEKEKREKEKKEKEEKDKKKGKGEKEEEGKEEGGKGKGKKKEKEKGKEEEQEKEKGSGKGSEKGSEKGECDTDEEVEFLFAVPEEVREYRGDPMDRRAVLAHKEKLRQEEERMGRPHQKSSPSTNLPPHPGFPSYPQLFNAMNGRLKSDYVRRKEAEKRAAERARTEVERK
ncbi:unnamed protein product, partial [Closterium sp. NIES-54]